MDRNDHAHLYEYEGRTPEIGAIIYAPYKPQRLWKVVEVDRTRRYGIRCVNGDGDEAWLDPLAWKSLEDLIDDHARKLDGHRKRLAEAKGWATP